MDLCGICTVPVIGELDHGPVGAGDWVTLGCTSSCCADTHQALNSDLGQNP